MIRRVVASGLRRLAARAAGEDPDVLALRRRLKEEQRRTALLDERVRKAAVIHERATRRLAELKQCLRGMEAKLLTQRRSMLSSRLLVDLLPVRAARPRGPAAERELAGAREQAFARTSPAYRDSMADADGRRAQLQRIDIAGVRWWVPLEPMLPDRAERAVEQSFPFRTLMQTREVAIGGTMLDIGANIGRTSITRVLLGDVRAVYAAEPEPLNYACLVQNVFEQDVRGFVLPDRVAIGAERGEMRLQRSRFMGGHRVLSGDARPSRYAMETVAVQVWPLDGWMSQHGVEPEAVTFVKVDTQGFEVNVLRGAGRLLSEYGVAWQLEVDPRLLERARSSVPDLLALIGHHFTHAIDLGPADPGPRVVPTTRLGEALAYLGTRAHKTDVLVFRMPDGAAVGC